MVSSFTRWRKDLDSNKLFCGATDAIYPSGMLKEEYADAIKANRFDETNVKEIMKGIDGVFFTGGEDISPSLFKDPKKEENMGEGINATRDISDYTLMSYCVQKDIPAFAVCRGEQMMGIVHGVTFIQDLPVYYQIGRASCRERV